MSLSNRPEAEDVDARFPFAVGIVFALVVVGTIALMAMEGTLAALAVIGVDGVVAGLWTAAAAGVGHWIVRRLVAQVHPALAFATKAGMGLGVYALVLLGLGMAEWLNGVSVWGMFFVGIGLGIAALAPFLLRCKNAAAEAIAPRRIYRWVWVVPAVSLGMALVGAAVVPGVLWREAGDPHPYDALSYHLQVPREWYEAGRIEALQHNVFSHFPMGVEVHFLAGMHLLGGPWKGMYFASFLNAAMAVVMVAGVYGAARTLGESGRQEEGWLAVMASAAVGCVPWVVMLSSIAYAEVGLMLYGALALAWVLVSDMPSAAGTPRRQAGTLTACALGGVFAGFACGTKYPAVPMLLLGVPVALMVARVVGWQAGARAPMPRVVGGAVAFMISGLVVFSPWLVRNIAWTGNPVFPLAMGVLGQGHFTDEQVDRFERAHAAPVERKTIGGKLAAWATRGLVENDRGERELDQGEFTFNWRYGFVLVPVGIVVAGLSGRSPRAVFTLVMLLWLSVVWLAFTHLIGRFMVLSIPLIGMVVGSMRPRVGELALAGVMLAVVAISGWINLAPMLVRAAGYGAFALPDLAVFVPAEAEAAVQSGRRIALVGDAQAFVYPVPMERLSYRTVFDVPAGEPVTQWHAGEPADVELIVVPELERLSATYLHLQPVPPDLRGRQIVVRPVQQSP